MSRREAAELCNPSAPPPLPPRGIRNVVHLRRVVALVLASSGCAALGATTYRAPAHRGPALEAGEGHANVQTPEAIAAQLRAPAGVQIERACTPTGPETCFDAIDDNCNGIIDEGCGVRTGPLQFAIAWFGQADVDLEVTDPSGKKSELEGRHSQGLLKDRDCGGQRDVCHGQNMENVVFVGERAPRGAFLVAVKLEASAPHEHFPLRVRFGGRVGARTFGANLEFSTPKEEKVFEVWVDADGP